ncbi:uncharacterized protein F5891DRAFT_992782 [Suillus fuscotomentosus]|uniref:Uncharacterized protein n=1 Tax=Suillus fuscotomentosus TaxID=1912939 RepID=A0AAD4HU52_9AGAM|nr:uncharacterized protein F5891DRAFT_992782 [Suillus fuscotomentosus]KAG1908381.1 hypothetical protein F5891DRAFT_992782 [Suillus fuscotomentosus]
MTGEGRYQYYFHKPMLRRSNGIDDQAHKRYVWIYLPEEHLKIPMMVPDNQERHKTTYNITVDYYKHGMSYPNIISRHYNRDFRP